MGARAALDAISVVPGKLTPGARMTLITMGLLALDRDSRGVPARTYFGGWDRLAAAQGRFPSESARRTIGRHLAELVGVGVVEVVEHAAPNRPAVYALHLSGQGT